MGFDGRQHHGTAVPGPCRPGQCREGIAAVRERHPQARTARPIDHHEHLGRGPRRGAHRRRRVVARDHALLVGHLPVRLEAADLRAARRAQAARRQDRRAQREVQDDRLLPHLLDARDRRVDDVGPAVLAEGIRSEVRRLPLRHRPRVASHQRSVGGQSPRGGPVHRRARGEGLRTRAEPGTQRRRRSVHGTGRCARWARRRSPAWRGAEVPGLARADPVGRSAARGPVAAAIRRGVAAAAAPTAPAPRGARATAGGRVRFRSGWGWSTCRSSPRH